MRYLNTACQFLSISKHRSWYQVLDFSHRSALCTDVCCEMIHIVPYIFKDNNWINIDWWFRFHMHIYVLYIALKFKFDCLWKRPSHINCEKSGLYSDISVCWKLLIILFCFLCEYFTGAMKRDIHKHFHFIFENIPHKWTYTHVIR